MNTVKGKVSVWIWPTRDWELKEGETYDTAPFQARLSTDRVWEPDSVKVHTQEVYISVPPDVDLRQCMIDTLEEDRSKLLKETQEKLERINVKLTELRQLTHTPGLPDYPLEGELVQTPFGRDVA